MAIYKVTFNSVDFWEELGATLKSAPQFPMPAEVKESVHIKGATGDLTEATGYFSNLELQLNFRCLKRFARQEYQEFWDLKRKINQLFNNIIDDRLMFQDYPDRYYKVVSLDVSTVTKVSEHEVDFGVKFKCDPFLYNPNERIIDHQGTIYYDGDIPNAPIIKINAREGGNAKLTCCGNTSLEFTIPSGGMIEINNNPYSMVTLDGVPIVSKGNRPVFRPGQNTLEVSTEFGWIGAIRIIKNERYLG